MKEEYVCFDCAYYNPLAEQCNIYDVLLTLENSKTEDSCPNFRHKIMKPNKSQFEIKLQAIEERL